ncbi:MAG: hypothetical protein HKN43_05030 [Rhodothermales bacterium]|nr:hypothetical protein [Rhodothermales bacterium]
MKGFKLQTETIQWLASIGYPIDSRTDREIETMFLWEAAQLEIEPLLLEKIVQAMWEVPHEHPVKPIRKPWKPPAPKLP